MRIFLAVSLALLASQSSAQSVSTPSGSPGGAGVLAGSATPLSPPATFGGGACNVTIIESQSINNFHYQDDRWLATALSLGMTATIAPQTTLDSNAFFATTDALLVTSGIIDIPQNRRQTILDFLLAGGSVYVQSEYQITYESNITFAWLVLQLGSSFTWGGTGAGDLAPMAVSGTLATTPNAVAPLGYFWYGAFGSGGVGVTPFLNSGGADYGWTFEPPTADVGRLVTTTDQDWVRDVLNAPANTAPALMENILGYLCVGGGGGGSISYACDPAANHSGGTYARIQALGNNAATATVTRLECVDGPPGEFGYFLVSASLLDPGNAVANGFLCLGLPIGRYAPASGATLNSLGQFDAAGVLQNVVGTSVSGQGFDVPQGLPTPPGGTVTSGATWSFQCWYRDGNRSNFSTAVTVLFQ